MSTGWTLEQSPTVDQPMEYAIRASEDSSIANGQILAVDERGPGRVVEAFGDLGNADSIVVFVPGSGWNLENFDDDNKAMSPRQAAQGVVERTRRLQPEAEVAAVAWLGYRPPEGIGMAALRSERAVAGAEELGRLIDRLPTSATITLACHSYGSVVCGRAAPDIRVDNIVTIGGTGMDVRGVEALGTTATVWAAQAPDDNIRFVPEFRFAGFGHGRGPVSNGFGGHRLDAGDAQEHGDYYQPGGETLRNLARIALHRYAEVTHA